VNVTIGTAPDSWGVWFADDPKQTPWERCLDEIVEAGFTLTELGPYGYLPTDLDTVQSELAKRGLKVAGSVALDNLEDPAAWPSLERQVLGVGELLAGLGATFLVLIDASYTDPVTGRQLAPARLDADAWARLIHTTNRVADISRERFGLRTVFHHHAETHVEYEDQCEALLAQTDRSRVEFCLDLGHFAYRGGDPVAFMRRHHARIPYLHLKSVDRDLQKKVERENIPFAIAVGMDLFVEPAKGAVDFLAFRDVLRDIDYQGWGIVEQDMYPAPFDKPLPIAKRTRAYLKEIGLG
jgi:inosose dehydratase